MLAGLALSTGSWPFLTLCGLSPSSTFLGLGPLPWKHLWFVCPPSSFFLVLRIRDGITNHNYWSCDRRFVETTFVPPPFTLIVKLLTPTQLLWWLDEDVWGPILPTTYIYFNCQVGASHSKHSTNQCACHYSWPYHASSTLYLLTLALSNCHVHPTHIISLFP